MKPIRMAALCGVGCSCLIVATTIATRQAPVDRQCVWSIAATISGSPFDIPNLDSLGPSLSAADVTDCEARFVADPFAIRHENQWVMFFEVLNETTDQGDIGTATSENGRDWTYGRIVLDEPFHLSYPLVFDDNGQLYMVPESEAANGVRLYRATSFPTEWQFEKTLINGADLADPTIFQHDDRWWMFVGKAGSHDSLRLFVAHAVTGPWQEHPASPLIKEDPSRARPAGQVVTLNGKLFRLAQDCSIRYGQSVRAFEITDLSPTRYAEIERSPAILTAQDGHWNSSGMHHLHAIPLRGGNWMCCVDGHFKRLVWGWNRR